MLLFFVSCTILQGNFSSSFFFPFSLFNSEFILMLTLLKAPLIIIRLQTIVCLLMISSFLGESRNRTLLPSPALKPSIEPYLTHHLRLSSSIAYLETWMFTFSLLLPLMWQSYKERHECSINIHKVRANLPCQPNWWHYEVADDKQEMKSNSWKLCRKLRKIQALDKRNQHEPMSLPIRWMHSSDDACGLTEVPKGEWDIN